MLNPYRACGVPLNPRSVFSNWESLKELINMNYGRFVEAKPNFIETMTVLTIFVFICGIFASQRFSLNGLNAFICILPYAFFFQYLFSKKLDIALSLLAISLFLVSDNGGGEYSETPSVLRYLIYLSCLLMLGYLSKAKIALKKLLFLAILFFVLLMTTWAFHMAVFDTVTFQRDILVLIILSLVLIGRSEAKLSLPLLFATSFGFLIGEVVNISWFFNYSDGDYLNYNGLKAFIVFPFLYVAFIKKSSPLAIVLFFLTILVLVNYGSRMLIATFVSLLLVAFIVDKYMHLRAMLFLTIFVAMVIVAINLFGLPTIGTEGSRYKAVQFILQFIIDIESADFFSALRLLDFARYAEHQMFFSRSVFEVVFGSGLGSGMADTEGLLADVGFNQTAFSVEELSSSLYFGFHDYWIDFGLRFGFFVVILILYLVSIKQILLGRLVCGILFGLLLINTTFGTSGIIFTALLIKFYPEPIHRNPLTTRS
jgi:hypothetical protein